MERLGFIGLGIMGKPMAGNLLAAGYPVTVHNRSRGAVDELAARGASPAASAEEVASESDIVITMLPDSPDVEQVVLGPGGGAVYIDMSTIAPASTRAIATALVERGVEALDAPVSGGEVGARDGTLTIMAGGSEQALARTQPIFDVLGKVTTHVGPAGAGQVAKAANQIVVAVTIQAVAEALILARQAGADAERVRTALLGGFAQSRILDLHGERMLHRAYDPGFKLALHRKDLGIALQLAREQRVPLFATAGVAELMDALLAQGAGDRDSSVLASLYEQLANVAPGEAER
jgi:2-hydroxy-3-oxopropionate reductase